MKKTIILFLSIFINSIAFVSAQTVGQNGKEVMEVEITNGHIDVVSGIVYSQITTSRENRTLKMTLLIPQTDEPKPAIVFCPGGGFISAANERYIEMRMALAEAGFVVASIEYRTVPDKFPALVIDGKSAIRYLREHAEQFGINPEKIGVIGDSAGGYLSQMLGVTGNENEFDQGDFTDKRSDVQAVVTIYGISNLLNIGEGYSKEIQEVHASPAVTEALLVHGPAFASFKGSSILSDTIKAMHASPMGHIKKGLPPFLIMHGTADKLVSQVQSDQLYEALRKNGTDVQYVLVKNAGHADIYWFQKPIIEKVVNWFTDKLK